MILFVYIEYQNFTRIHKEEIIQQVLILFQENILTTVRDGIQSYNHTGTMSNHVVFPIKYGY